MITLYQLHWSHYVEKVRWALDFKGLQWKAVDIDPFSKREMQHLGRRRTMESGVKLHTVPTLQDESTGAVVSESAEIMQYLERTYPAPALYPEDAAARAEVCRWVLWLDSTLALAARRLAYTQLAVEYPGMIAELFVPKIVGPGAAGGLKGKIAGALIAGILSRRFRFGCNRADGVFEQLEQCLLLAAARLSQRPYLVGDRFTAADLTLAALMRPVLLVPYFMEHPGLQRLFEWRNVQLREHGRELQMGYEKVLHAVRQRRGWSRGAVRWLPSSHRGAEPSLTEVPAITEARNDHQNLGWMPQVRGLVWYLRLVLTSGLGRTSYPAR
jgi:glutathione S-transferase